MNNKKGGVGAKIILVLILMIASAVGGAYGYRVLDGKFAVSDAKKYVDNIRLSDYDTEEAATLQGVISMTLNPNSRQLKHVRTSTMSLTTSSLRLRKSKPRQKRNSRKREELPTTIIITTITPAIMTIPMTSTVAMTSATTITATTAMQTAARATAATTAILPAVCSAEFSEATAMTTPAAKTMMMTRSIKDII